MRYIAASGMILACVCLESAQGGRANLVDSAKILQPDDSKGGPVDLSKAATILADVAGEGQVAWTDGADGLPAILELRWAEPVRIGIVACRWAWAPSDYAIELQADGTWRTFAEIRGNTITRDKIFLHQDKPVATSGLRLVVRACTDAKRRCGLRAFEVYDPSRLPERIERFLKRSTPCQFAEPRKGSKPVDVAEATITELLNAPIPTWEPIPRKLYSGRPEGKRVNELASQRRQLLAACATAYAATGRRDLARRAWDVLGTCIGHYDRHQGFRFVGREWQAVTFQEPGYMLTCAFEAYDQIADALTRQERLRFLYFGLDLGDYQLRSIREFTPMPEKVTSRSQIPNWVPNSFGALAMAAAYLRDCPETSVWMTECDAKFPGMFKDVFFLRDGTWWECSPAHHGYVLTGICKYATAKHLLGEPIWNKRFSGLRLSDTFEALVKTANPAGEYPSINDSYGHDLPIRKAYPGFVDAATMMGRGDFLYAWRAEPRRPPSFVERPLETPVRPPSYTSLVMPHAGQAIFRDGWSGDDLFFFLDYGPHGGGHGHPDKLSFILYADGHHWIPDAGCSPHYCIFPEQWNWHKQTVAHNTVLVDDKSQARCTGRLVMWHTSKTHDLVSAEYRDGYAFRGLVRLRLDGRPHQLTITPRELTPLRIGAVRLEPVGGGKPLTIAAPSFEVTDGSLVDDEGVPGGKAVRLASKKAVVTVSLPKREGEFKLSVLGSGQNRSHDSVYLALDGRRVGDAALGIRKVAWAEARGPVERVVHRRTSYHPRGGYVLIHDTLRGLDLDAPHKLDWLLHVYGELAVQQPGRLTFAHGDHRLLVASPHIGTEPVEIKQGLCGGFLRDQWTGEGYPGKGDPGWIYIPYFGLADEVAPDAPEAHFWVVLVPYRGEQPDVQLDRVESASGRAVARLRIGGTVTTFTETFAPPKVEVSIMGDGDSTRRHTFTP